VHVNFDSDDPEYPPDICVEKDLKYLNILNLPSLLYWDSNNTNALSKVLFEIKDIFMQEQMKFISSLNISSLQFDLSMISHRQNVEIAFQKPNLILIKIPINITLESGQKMDTNIRELISHEIGLSLLVKYIFAENYITNIHVDVLDLDKEISEVFKPPPYKNEYNLLDYLDCFEKELKNSMIKKFNLVNLRKSFIKLLKNQFDTSKVVKLMITEADLDNFNFVSFTLKYLKVDLSLEENFNLPEWKKEDFPFYRILS
ncbi:hypothetical protein HDU92_003163, partial [Lobulomyces angularis]